MAIELVTGHAGSAHVSSEDVGLYQSLTAGSGRYVLGDAPTLTMTDANTLTVSPCSLLVDGRYVRLTGTNTLTIQSGAQTGQRIDIVYVRYAQASDGTESASLGVKTGDTATTATAPTLDYTGSVLDGDQNVDIEIARVTLDGLTPTATWTLPTWALPISHGGTGSTTAGGALTELGVNLLLASGGTAKVYVGTKIVSASGASYSALFTSSEMLSKFGRAFNQATDFIAVMNGDADAFNQELYAAAYHWDGTIGLRFGGSQTSQARINYLLVMVG